MDIKDHAKDKVLVIVVELIFFLFRTKIFLNEEPKNHIHKRMSISLKIINHTIDYYQLHTNDFLSRSGTTNARKNQSGTHSALLKLIWHPQCATHVSLVPPRRNSNLSDHSRYWSGRSDQSWLGSRTSSWAIIHPASQAFLPLMYKFFQIKNSTNKFPQFILRTCKFLQGNHST